MKFSCEKALLQNAVGVASRAVSQKSSIPALEGLLLRAAETVTVSGYNMRLLVVAASPPDSSRRCVPYKSTAPQPPGPGLPEQAPSV